MDFSTNTTQLCKFVRDVEQTGGGDFEECYELALKEIREKLSWTNGKRAITIRVTLFVFTYKENSVIKCWTRNRENLGSNPGYGGLLL